MKETWTDLDGIGEPIWSAAQPVTTGPRAEMIVCYHGYQVIDRLGSHLTSSVAYTRQLIYFK